MSKIRLFKWKSANPKINMKNGVLLIVVGVFQILLILTTKAGGTVMIAGWAGVILVDSYGFALLIDGLTHRRHGMVVA